MKNKKNWMTVVSLMLIIIVYLISRKAANQAQQQDGNTETGYTVTGSDTGYTITDTEPAITDSIPYTEYRFRSDKLLTQHYEKHGIEMGFDSKEAYEKAASDAVNNPEALHKIEAEDGDDVYYVEATNEFVVVSTDGYIRTYFYPSGGKAYFDRQ